MVSIYTLNAQGVRVRPLAESEAEWAKFLDAEPDSMEWAFGSIPATFAGYSAQLEGDTTSRRKKAGLERAKAEGRLHKFC